MDYFYIYLVLVLVSLATSVASMYGMGAYDHERTSEFYVMSSVGFNVSLLILSVSSILLIKTSQTAMICREGIKPRKPAVGVAPTAPRVGVAAPVVAAPVVAAAPGYCPPECAPMRMV